VTLVAGFIVLLGFAVREQEDWIALTLGTALIVVAGDVACYYYGVLLVFAFLWDRWPWTSVGLCVLAAVSIAAPVLLKDDDLYVALSVAVVLYVTAVVAQAARSRGLIRSGRPAGPG
jgi:hypothetical protein